MMTERGKENDGKNSVRPESPHQKAMTARNKKENKGRPTRETEKGYTAFQMSQRKREKNAIAKYVANSIITEGMTIFLDAGSTVHQVGLRLFDDPEMSGLTILTNNMLIFNEFTNRTDFMSRRGNELSLTGGIYNQNHEALFGDVAVDALKGFGAHVVIIGTSGLMVDLNNRIKEGHPGAYYHDIVGSEVKTKKSIAGGRARQRVLVCDYSKIGNWDASCFATIEQLAENVTECTIVTSIVPKSEAKRDLFDRRYHETSKSLRKLALRNVKLVRVDHQGKDVAAHGK